MPQQARVTSIEALDDFRARLIVYVEKASVAVDDALDDVSRTRQWLQSEQLNYWGTQLRRRARDLETVEQELFSARIGNLHEATNTRQLAVRKARQSMDEAQAKLALLKKWNRHYDSEVAPLVAQVEKLRVLLSTDLQQAVTLLGRSVETLDAYSDRMAPQLQAPTEPPSGGTELDSQPAPIHKAVNPAGEQEGSS
mgnify:CR=1 FL=1